MGEISQQEYPRDALLEACPFCDYQLEGLPIEHRCPECGRPFDRRWRVFGHLPTWYCGSRWTRWIRGAFYVFGLLFYVPFLIRPAVRDYPSLVLACGVVVLVAWDLWDQFRRPRWFVTVGPDGVSLCCRGDRRWEHYSLYEISEAEAGPWGTIQLTADGKKHFVGVCITRQEAERCAEYINSLIDRSR